MMMLCNWPLRTKMEHSKIEIGNVNIYQCPKAVPADAPQISIGDLHSNAMVLMFFLVRNGVVTISDEHYERLQQIYVKQDLISEDIKEFNKIIDALEIEKKPLVRLIGDAIADRGQNDYFIFKILEKLKRGRVETEILLSNHDMEFIIRYELKHPLFISSPFFHSINGVTALLDAGIITQKEIDILVNDHYLPSLKLISYSLHEGNITIYSHAGIGLETIRSLANRFKDYGVVYKDNTAQELAQTIEDINAVFKQHVKDGTVHKLIVHSVEQMKPDYKTDPVTFLLWNRDYQYLDRDVEHNGYKVYYVHGHDSGEPSYGHIINLDSWLGKTVDANVEQHKSLASQGESLLNAVASPSVQFSLQLRQLIKKAKKLLDDGHAKAAKSAMNLLSSLYNAHEQYQEDNDYSAFNNTCNKAIEKHRPQLEQHRGWSELLINLLLTVATVGLGLIVKGIYNLATNRSFFFVHQTESGQILDEIKEGISNYTLG